VKEWQIPGRAGLRGEKVDAQTSCLVADPRAPSFSASTLASGPMESNLLSLARWAIFSRLTIILLGNAD